MKTIHYYFFLILLIEIFSSDNNVYRFKIGLYNKKYSDKYMINNIIYNTIYTNLSIGTSSQIIPFELKTDSQTFCVTPEFFNKTISTSYEETSKEPVEIDYEDARNAFKAKDLLHINETLTQKINFLLATRILYRNFKIGIIGLKIPYLVQKGVFPFFESLKDAKLINSFIWTLKLNDNLSLYDQVYYNKTKDNIIGEFIIGDEPCNYENDSYRYNSEGYLRINPEFSGESRNWKFSFNKIYISLKVDSENISNIYYDDDKEVLISVNYPFISGPQYFYYFMEEHFLSELIFDNICSDNTENRYTYIECEPTLKLESFPNITFEQIGFGYSFTLTPEDLFIFDKEKNKYIYLIFINDGSSIWEFGIPFLRKYQFVFNIDARTIGFYINSTGPNNKDDEDHKENDGGKEDKNKSKEGKGQSDKRKIVLIVVLSAISGTLFIFIGMLIQKTICNKDRKQRANELKDNFEYLSENADENRLTINSEKKIMGDN